MTVDMIYENILETIDSDELWSYCERVYKKSDYDSVDDMLESLMALEYFSNSKFHDVLEEYLREQGKDIDDAVRGYMPYKKGFLMFHGIGYDWKSSDLLGGSSDGTEYKKFINWVHNKGYEIY